jgi:hypothetical protein
MFISSDKTERYQRLDERVSGGQRQRDARNGREGMKRYFEIRISETHHEFGFV